MPNITPLQQAFSSGEISPRLWMRADNTRIRNKGLASVENFITKPRGPLKSRDGFRFIGKVVATGVEVINVFPAETTITITTPDVDVVIT